MWILNLSSFFDLIFFLNIPFFIEDGKFRHTVWVYSNRGPFVLNRPVQSATMNHTLSQFQVKPSVRTYNLKAGLLLVKIWREYDHKIRNWYKELDFIRSYAFLLKVNINMKNFFKKKKSKLWNRDSIIEKYRWIINLLLHYLLNTASAKISRTFFC